MRVVFFLGFVFELILLSRINVWGFVMLSVFLMLSSCVLKVDWFLSRFCLLLILVMR